MDDPDETNETDDDFVLERNEELEGFNLNRAGAIFNYDIPYSIENYIHRIGRTGRAGKEGSALTFLTPSDRSMWNSITRLINPDFKISKESQ